MLYHWPFLGLSEVWNRLFLHFSCLKLFFLYLIVLVIPLNPQFHEKSKKCVAEQMSGLWPVCFTHILKVSHKQKIPCADYLHAPLETLLPPLFQFSDDMGWGYFSSSPAALLLVVSRKGVVTVKYCPLVEVSFYKFPAFKLSILMTSLILLSFSSEYKSI